MKTDKCILRSVIRVLLSHWWLVILLVLAIFASMALQLAPAFIIRKIIDEHFSRGMFAGVWRLACIYLLVVSGANIVDFVKVSITTILGQGILMELRHSMSKRLMELPISYFTQTPAGDTMSRLTTDVDAINSLFSDGIIDVAADLVKMTGLILSLYYLAPQLIWLIAAAVPLVFFFTNVFRKRIFKFQKQVRNCVSAIYTFIQEWFSGIGTVKAYSVEAEAGIKFQGLLGNLFGSVSSIAGYDSWFPCIMQTIRAAVIAAALWLCMDNGTAFSFGLSVGTIAAVADLIGKLFAPIEALATEFQTIQESFAGIARVNEFALQPVEERPRENSAADRNAGIDINNLEFAYDERKVLRGISMHIPKGKKAVLIGRSGAGKTTLLHISAGLYRPLAGTVRICGVDPFCLPPQKRRALIGIVPQMPQVFDGTIMDNITLGDTSISPGEVEAAAKTVGIHNTIASLPDTYDTPIGEAVSGLSGGELQLLSLARAIAANPPVLLLDEPTSGMDAGTEQRVFAAIRRIGEGRTILSISHRISGMLDADIIHLVADGEIVESGTPEELADRKGWFVMYRNMEKAGWDMG